MITGTCTLTKLVDVMLIVLSVVQDQVRYSIISGIPGSLYFRIDEVTGVIGVSSALTQTGQEQFAVCHLYFSFQT